MTKGIFALLGIFVVTTVLWVLAKDPSIAFNEQFQAQPMRFISQISALWVFVMLCFSFLLSSRFKWLDKQWGGLDKIYKLHQYIGGLSFALVIEHPLLLALQALPNKALALGYFFPTVNAWLWGAIALYGFMLILIPSLFMRLPYQLWKFLHGFIGIPLAFLALHLLFTTSDYSNSWMLTAWLILWIGIAAYAYIFKKFLYRYLGPHYPFKVIKNEQLGDILNLYLEPNPTPDRTYFAGEFVYLRLKSGKHNNEEHPFSVSWAGPNTVLRISIKMVGDFTKALADVKIGDMIEVYGPYGKMAEKFYLPTHKDAVLISGGIGVTPFLGLLYGKNNPSQKVWCYYCTSTKTEAVFDPELKHIAAKLPSLEYHLQVSETDGRLTADQLAKEIPDFKKKLYFICGPKPMMDAMSEQLYKAGISQKSIVMEDFNFIS